MKSLKDTMNGAGGETDPQKKKEATQDAFNKMLEAQSAYSDALKDPSGARKAEEDKEKEKHDAGISERDEEEDALDDDEEDTYSIVGSLEADPFENKVSNESPIGAALIGSKVGDVISVEGPNGSYDIKVLKIA